MPLSERILGRTPSTDVKNPLSGEVIAPAGQVIDEVVAEEIETAGVDEVKVRTVLTCEAAHNGICAKCYGPLTFNSFIFG